jgi:hypothetical protein
MRVPDVDRYVHKSPHEVHFVGYFWLHLTLRFTVTPDFFSSRKTALSASARDFAALVLKMSTVAMKVYTWATVDSSILDVIFYHTFVSSSCYSCPRASSSVFSISPNLVLVFRKALFLISYIHFLRCTFCHEAIILPAKKFRCCSSAIPFLLLKHSVVALETLFKSCSSPPLVHIMLS